MSKTITMDEFNLISKIADRMIALIQECNSKPPRKITLMMDLEHAHKRFNLDLSGLLNAKDFDFIHDVLGIYNNIDRINPDDCNWNYFCPRYARTEV